MHSRHVPTNLIRREPLAPGYGSQSILKLLSIPRCNRNFGKKQNGHGVWRLPQTKNSPLSRLPKTHSNCTRRNQPAKTMRLFFVRTQNVAARNLVYVHAASGSVRATPLRSPLLRRRVVPQAASLAPKGLPSKPDYDLRRSVRTVLIGSAGYGAWNVEKNGNEYTYMHGHVH